LPDDRWQLDEAGHAMSGRNTGLTFSLGQAVEVRLSEAVPRTGGMVFSLMQGDPRGASRGKRGAGSAPRAKSSAKAARPR